MAYIITIWIIIGLATLGLITALILLHNLLKNKSSIEHKIKIKTFITNCMSTVTIMITLLWWISLLIFQYVLGNQGETAHQYLIMSIVVPIIAIIVYLSFIGMQNIVNNKFHVNIKGQKSLAYMKLTTLITSVIYAFLVNYGVQILLLQN